MGCYALTGFWTKAVTHDYLRALPAVFAAVILGRAVNQRLSGDSFLRYVHIGLIATAVMLLVQSSG
jgi:hypothetical protein